MIQGDRRGCKNPTMRFSAKISVATYPWYDLPPLGSEYEGVSQLWLFSLMWIHLLFSSLSPLLPLPDLALLVGVHRGVGGAGEVPGELGHVGERPTDPVLFGIDA